MTTIITRRAASSQGLCLLLSCPKNLGFAERGFGMLNHHLMSQVNHKKNAEENQ